jgi:hypothetical protein
MERVDGVTLRQWAATGPTPARALELMARVCDAVEHAHARGVVHRDLKPENILVRPDDRPVVLDFGVARLLDADVRATTFMTSLGMLVGTIRYMSPEQADARPEGIGPPSDVHALAVLTCELLTGRLPFEVPEDSVHRALVAVMTQPPRPLSELPPSLRRPLEAVLGAALVKDPRARTASAATLAEDLRRVGAGERPLARIPRAIRPWREHLPLRTWFALGSLGVLLGLLAGAFRITPTPLDRLQGWIRPLEVLARVDAELDSVDTAVHRTTRTLARLQQVAPRAERAVALLGTVQSQPWHACMLRFARFRQGEVAYLTGERLHDPALLERAAALWLASAPGRLPVRESFPDLPGFADDHARQHDPLSGFAAAAMAFGNAAGLGMTQSRLERAQQCIDASMRAYRTQHGLTSQPPGQWPEAHRRWLGEWRVRRAANLARLAAVRDDSVAVRRARDAMRAAHDLRVLPDHVAAQAWHFAELGAAELRWAWVGRDTTALDSAEAALRHAYRLRRNLPGYRSIVETAPQLVEVERVRMRLTSDPDRRRAALARAFAWLEIPDDGILLLSAQDSVGLSLARAALLQDAGILERDTARYTEARRILDRMVPRLPADRMPTAASACAALRLRDAALRLAVAESGLERETLRLLRDQTLPWLERAHHPRLRRIVDATEEATQGRTVAPFRLEEPVAEPY